MITVSNNAVKHLRSLLEDRGAENGQGLRLKVQKGGCAGMEYVMQLDKATTEDQIFTNDGVDVIIDKESMVFLEGVTLDYEDSLNDSGFKVHNPNATRSCGCGSSFEPT